MANQPDWHFCSKCHAMIFDDKHPKLGVCPATSHGHIAQGFNFFLPHDVPGATPNSQDGWAFCNRCNAMVFTDPKQPQGMGKCPATSDGHHPQGFNFFLPHDVAETATAQPSWNFCTACRVMFFNDKQGQLGICQGNSHGHQPAGLMFVLPHDISDTLAFDFSGITFPDGIPVGGNLHLTMNKDGFFHFFGHFHNSGAPSFRVSTILSVKDSQHRLYLFSDSSGLGGLIGDRDFDIDQNGQNNSIADFWVSLAAGTTAIAKSRTAFDLDALLNEVKNAEGDIQKIIAVVGPIAQLV